MRTLLASVAVLLAVVVTPAAEKAPPVRIFFLGDDGHHEPHARFEQLKPVLAKCGIALTYTDKATDLNAKTLNQYDGLIVYANIGKIEPDQEQAVLDYVASGKGFIPLHCASYCFLNSAKYVDLVGAQFRSHGTGTFRTQIAHPEHPIMKGFKGFESWDETYLHHRHNDKDRTVLEYRVDGEIREPWTWVRSQGKGRVFYTAWGHDQRTWSNPGFHNLVERGIRWAVGGDPSVVSSFVDRPEMTPLGKGAFEYVSANVPSYPPSKVWGVTAPPIRKMQKPLPPAESIPHISHPTDFELKLFASEAQFGGKPICMNWDERGRLWVAITMDYPNELQVPGKGRDRILICEDTDGDGVADKVTVFADHLSIPTSLTFARGGVIVQQAPDTLFLRDTDGDGVADERTVLFTGWHTDDTHAGPSNLRLGLDNWIYGMVGYAGFDGTVGGEHHHFGQGFYRFKSDGSKLEFLRSTNNNSWGVGFSEEGLLFGSTANGNPSVYLPIPNRYYEAVRGWSPTVLGTIADSWKFQPVTDKIRQVDYHGGFTAAAGHALYTARTYPKEYWNKTSFVCEPTGHITATFQLQPEGTNFHAHYGWNLVASDDEWCAPIMAEVGPDGNVWVIDWYNFIVQHNPTPAGWKTGKGGAYETELRDKKFGRVYRLVAKQSAIKPSFSLKDATPEVLVSTLKNDNQFWRLQAQRLLVERGKRDIVPALLKLIGDRSVDEIGLNVGAIHALWTLHGLGALDGTIAEVQRAVVAGLKHPSAGVRRNAAAVLPREKDALGSLLESGSLTDADAQVRLAACLALAEMPTDTRAGQALAAALRRPENFNDRWLPDALTSACAQHAASFLAAVAHDHEPLSPRGIMVVGVVAEHYGRSGPVDTVKPVLAELGATDLATTQAVLAGLVRGWPKDKPVALVADQEKGLLDLLTRLPASGKGDLLRLANAWGAKTLQEQSAAIARGLLASANNAKQSDADRIAAARQAIELQPESEDVANAILALVTPRVSPELATGLLEALGESYARDLGASLSAQLSGWAPQARSVAVRVLLRRANTAMALLHSIEGGKSTLSDLPLDQKQALQSYPDRQVAALAKKLLARGGGLPNADREKVVRQFLPGVQQGGDAVKGKAVFTAQCAKCHIHGKEGGKIGPELTGMATHTRENLLIAILDPSRDVEGNFRAYMAETRDGHVVTGLLSSETKTAVELIDAEGKKHLLLRENIEQLNVSPKSLMPEGFEQQIKEDDLRNLLAFLTKPGKYLPLQLDKVASAISTRGMFYGEENQVERLIFADWTPKSVDGVPFVLVDPKGTQVPNVLLFYGPEGKLPPKMPKAVQLPCNSGAKAIHLLSGVSGWGFPYSGDKTVSLIVRLHYADGKTEDISLRNGEQFADYINRVDVPGSKFAFDLNGRQIRYLSVKPTRTEKISEVEFVKGPDATAPVIMAVTVETLE